MITKAHHPTSLTEGERMNRRHEGTEARSHEVVAKAKRVKVQRTHVPTRSLPAWSPLRAYVPSCLCASINQCPKKSQNVPFYRTHLDRTCQRAPRRTMSSRQCETNPPPWRSLAHLASWRSRLPSPRAKTAKPSQVPPAQTCHNLPKPASPPRAGAKRSHPLPLFLSRNASKLVC